jgi:hypothetical protein
MLLAMALAPSLHSPPLPALTPPSLPPLHTPPPPLAPPLHPSGSTARTSAARRTRGGGGDEGRGGEPTARARLETGTAGLAQLQVQYCTQHTLYTVLIDCRYSTARSKIHYTLY